MEKSGKETVTGNDMNDNVELEMTEEILVVIWR
jgi:hypothetical protein